MKTILTAIIVLVAASMIPAVLSASTQTPNQVNQDFIIPSWIKNNAGWWADGQIDDSSFISGIQWLISNDVITIPHTVQGAGDGDNVIPRWIKNNAGWWADDKIQDIAFIGGIKYLISEGIMIIEQEVVEPVEEVVEPVEEVVEPVEEVVEPVEEVVEIRDFYMEVNGSNCCINWSYVGSDYRFQIETFDEKQGNYIDGVEINVKIISKGGEIRDAFVVTTEGGIYESSITIPSIDWYAENILSVTGEYYGVEKIIEKEFTVFAKKGSAVTDETSKSRKKMFIVDEDDVNEYTLTTEYWLSSRAFVDSISVSSQESVPTDIAFNSDGDKMFIVGSNGDEVNEYTLTTAWDISSASAVDSFSVASEENTPTGIAFSESGKKMFITGNTGASVFEYTLTTAWDVSSASFVDSFSVASQESVPTGIAFSESGKKMFIVGSNGDEVNEYTLTTAWDVSSASAVDSLSVSGHENTPTGIAFSESGKKMFIVGGTSPSCEVNEWTLTTAWDLSSAAHTGIVYNLRDQDDNPQGIVFG